MEFSEPFRQLIPEIIGPFRLVREVGAGGNGLVFLAERISQFTQKVAVKVLFPELFPDDGSALVNSEFATLYELKHPGIVGILDSGTTSGGLRYLVMEYVDGDTIETHCDERRLSIAQRIEVLCEVMDALEYAHRRLVIHGDLKPDNIRMTSSGRARLLDFGTSTLLPETPSNQLDAKGPKASPEISRHTPLFASPEQRRGERLTIASDLYSLGLILRQILTGLKPAPSPIPSEKGVDASEPRIPASRMLAALDRETCGGIARNRSNTPESLRKTLGPDLDAIIERCLQVNPADRYESSQEVRDELKRFMMGYPLRTRHVGRCRRIYKWALRNRLAAGFTGILLFAVCLSVAGVVWRTAQANRERGIAQDRLRELVRLTDSFAGELIGSVQGLPGAEGAEDALLKNAHETIGALSIEEGDSQLQLELVRQLQKLAKLELARARDNAAAGGVAENDVRQAGNLLNHLNQGDAEVIQLRKENEALAGSRNGSGKEKKTH